MPIVLLSGLFSLFIAEGQQGVNKEPTDDEKSDKISDCRQLTKRPTISRIYMETFFSPKAKICILERGGGGGGNHLP